jgi:GNAT superfamily N-acetyltransferase
MSHAHALLLRPAEPSDRLQLIALSAQLGYDIDADGVAEHLRRLKHDPDQLLLVALLHGMPIGWVAAAVHHLLIVPAYVEIEGLVVDDGVRQQGVGRALMAADEAWASRRGVALVRLRSNILHEAAHAFYVRCGYTLTKTSHQFSKAIDPPMKIGL